MVQLPPSYGKAKACELWPFGGLLRPLPPHLLPPLRPPRLLHPQDYWCIMVHPTSCLIYYSIYYVITWITMCRSGRTNHLPGPCSLPPQLQWDATPAWPRSLECPFQSPPGSWSSSHFHMKSGKCSTFWWKNGKTHPRVDVNFGDLHGQDGLLKGIGFPSNCTGI